MKHEMVYRAGSQGFSSVGIPDGPPHWYCRCAQWSFIARPNSTRSTGNNQIEAAQSFRKHMEEAIMGGEGDSGNCA